LFLAAATFAPIAHAQVPATPAPGRPLNIILVLRDQTRSELPAAAGYHTPALDRLAQQGVTFRNHYIASAMCTPSRAAFYSGQPPQVNGVFDQLEAGYVPSLRKDRPNMGSMMKKLGYRTAFYGKWEMDFDILPPKSTVNYSDALQPYGFDVYQPDPPPARLTRATRPTFTPRPKASAGCGAPCRNCVNRGSHSS
jgi:arylsulfatase